MDSLTQAVLGAGVGAAVLGRRIGPRRAAIAGAVLGSLPDLDVIVPFDNPVDAFVLHRGPTHSLLMQAMITPLLGELLLRLFQGLRDRRALTYLAVYLCLSTHALLDAMTVYGTRVLWPLWPEPVGLGSIFIIDPLYTLPLLVLAVWALCLRHWTATFGRGLIAGLVLSCAYLGWSVAAQELVERRAHALLASRDIESTRMLAIPTPFNTLLWRVIVVDGARYLNLYVPALSSAGEVAVYEHPRGTDRMGCVDEIEDASRLARFSKGFYRYDVDDGSLVVSDLRMGLTPQYVFRFAVAHRVDGRFEEMPSRRQPVVRNGEEDLAWLLAALAGDVASRPMEARARLALSALRLPEERSGGC